MLRSKLLPQFGQTFGIRRFVAQIASSSYFAVIKVNVSFVQAQKIVDFDNLGTYENDFVIISLYRKSKGNASKIFVQFQQKNQN